MKLKQDIMTTSIKYFTKKICFQEIPDEISYTYFLTNCPNNCKNCHSPHLREDIGTSVAMSLPFDLQAQAGICSCILFMGGDDDKQIDSLAVNLAVCKAYGFKTALYSGFELEHATQKLDLLSLLDYIKVGPYIEELGGLKSKTTNQRLYKVTDGKITEDITNKFWRSLDENKSC